MWNGVESRHPSLKSSVQSFRDLGKVCKVQKYSLFSSNTLGTFVASFDFYLILT